MRSVRLVFGFLCLVCVALVADAREWVDATGKSRVTAEFVALRSGKAILEKTDGSIIAVPLERLSAADRDYIQSLTAPKPAATPANTPSTTAVGSSPTAASAAPAPVTAEGTQLASQVHAILEAKCYNCHGKDGTSEGGFNYVLNLEKISRTHLTPKEPTKSLLFERMTATDDSVMPPPGEEPRTTPADIATIKAWIMAGAPALPTTEKRGFIKNEQVVAAISKDLEAASERSRRFLRYFTLTHLYNAGVSEDELQTYRNAFNKLINSLSWNTNLVVPKAIDTAETVYRVDIRSLNWNLDTWKRIEEANPYFLALSTPDALACCEAAQCEQPYVRIDWFVLAASKPPLYHDVLGIPDTDAALEETLKVNVAANIEQEQVIRAGFNRSGVSQNNRLIEWHKSPYGSYWKSYDFGGNTGQQNLFEHPLGPEGDDPFKHDGGELIFTLPNGMQGYMLVDGSGSRIDKGPVEIVSDPKRPDKSVTNGVSCMSCHYTGVIPKTDEIGPLVRANPKAYEDSEYLLAIYREPQELQAVLDEDEKRFAAAMKKIGISSLSRSGEPISAMAARFEQELDVHLVSCEFGLPQEDFVKRLKNSNAMARSFGALLTPGGTIKRDVFATMFGEAALDFKLTASLTARVEFSSSASRSSTPSTTRSSDSSPSRPATSSRSTRDEKPGEVARFPDLGWGVSSLAFSPNGLFLAAGKTDRALLVFDVKEQSRAAMVDKLEQLGDVKASAFTPDGKRLLTGGYSGQILIWQVSKEGQVKPDEQFVGHSNEISCIAVAPDGRFALSGSTEKKLRYWQIGGREQHVIGGFEGTVKACCIPPTGRIGLATDGEVLLHVDLKTGEVERKLPLTRSWASGQTAAFSQDGSLVAVGDSYAMRVFQTKSGKELPVLQDKEIQWSAAFTPDGTRLITGGHGKVNVWDIKRGTKIASLPTAGTSYVQTLATSPDNKHVAAIPGSAGQSLQIFRVPSADR